MDAYQETFRTWDKIAGLYQEKFMDRREYDESYHRFIHRVGKEQARILEIACGPGNMARFFLAQQPRWKWEGFDVSPNMVELARKNVPHAEFWQMDTRELDGVGLHYDAVVCGFGLPYLSPADTEKLVHDLDKILLPGGMVYMSFVEGKSEDSDFKMSSQGDRVYFYYHEKSQLEKLFLQYHIEVTDSIEVKFPRSENQFETHHILIFKKGNLSV